ncbi:MAG: glycosyltransferase [Muribaculaceae bacterium]|nr:glycosyltransferase [Muribaculaceae bacterium]
MKILIINHSDTRGGASVVSRRLLDAFISEGVDARMLVVHASPEGLRNPRIACAASPASVKRTFLAEEAWNWANIGFSRSDLFKIDSATFGLPLHRHPRVLEADAILLNWVNQGMLSLDEIGRIAAMGKRIVWTMHDMWPVTGICHHAGQCLQYTRSDAPCARCPFVHGPTRLIPELSARTARRKIWLYDSIPDIEFVAVSSWLGRKAAESAITGGRRISVIPNVFPVDDFHTLPRTTRAEACLPFPDDTQLVLMGAARLDDPVKGFDTAVRVLNRLDSIRGRRPVAAVFFGQLRRPEVLDSLRLPHVHLGPIADKARIAELYAHASAVLSTSHYETLPGTLIEGQAAGAWPVSFDRGGQADIISDPSLGSLIPYGDDDSMAHALNDALAADTPARREHLSAAVRAKYSPRTLVRKYMELLSAELAR